MTPEYDEDLPPDVQDVARRLERDRPQASGHELDAIKQRALSHARTGRTRRWTPSLRSTWAGTARVVVTLLAIALAAPFAATKMGSSRNAADVVYVAPKTSEP